MRFQKRLLRNYCLFLLIAVITVCTISFYALLRNYLAEEYSYLRTISAQILRQLDVEYNSMQGTTEALLSDAGILEDLRLLSRTEVGSAYRTEAEISLNVEMNAYYIVKNYYRVLLYNGNGNIYASYNFDNRVVDSEIPEDQEVWIERTEGQRGRPVLIPLHTDPWGVREKPNVYGMIREILGYGCYIEVQQKEDSLSGIFEAYDDNIQVTALFGDNEVLFGEPDAAENELFRQFAGKKTDEIRVVRDSVSGKRLIVSAVYSELTGVTVLLTEDSSVILSKMARILWTMVPVLFVVVGVFAFFLFRASRNMATPINELRRQMEHTDLENMDAGIHIENSMDEIQALTQAYEELIKRLKESMTNEKNLLNLQLQARYDLLQAQINPHFFYNVLNVISYKGLALGDESICDICNSLSGMLRYATSNKARYATIEEEVEYLEQYLYLMKLRYLHKLEYQVSVAEEIKGHSVPKIVFQQVVENSIKHGYNQGGRVMRIRVNGYLESSGREWVMEIHDNGDGIREEVQKRLYEEMEEIKERLLSHHELIEMEIGGMGLLNTYARLLLYCGDEAKITIESSSEGTTVRIAAPFKEGEKNVSSADRG